MHCLIFNVNGDLQFCRPAGAYRIAHLLRKNGWDAEVIEWAALWNLDQLKELAKSRITTETKFLGFSHLLSTWTPALEDFCVWVKKQYPNIVFISGGAANPMYKTNVINYHIRGYSEIALFELLRYLFNNGKHPRFEVQKISGIKIINAYEQYPAFPWSELIIEYQKRDFLFSNEWLPIEFSRGCKFKCDFCNFPILGVKGDYSRSQEDFRSQVQTNYDQWGISEYIITDETFNDSTEKIKKFADVVETFKFNTWFSAFIRPDLLITRPHDKEELLRMNVLGQFYGIESFNHKSAKSIGKGMHPDRLKEGLIDVRKYFETTGRKMYRGTISLILGLPHETLETLESTKQWLATNWANQHQVFLTLEIAQGNLEHPSLISLDYTKYGYRKSLKSNIILNFEARVASGAGDINNLPLMWENDNMDIFQANKIEGEWANFFLANNNWKMSAFNLSFISDYDLNKRLDMNVNDYNEIAHLSYGIVNTYINKKLSI